MATILTVSAKVADSVSLHDELDAEVEVVATSPNACDLCIENAKLPDPIPPKLHENCRCELVMVNISEAF